MEIKFNPFTLKLDVSGCVAAGCRRQGVAELQATARGAAAGEHLALRSRASSEILLDKPYVRAVIRHGGALNLADLGKASERTEQAAAGVQARAPLHRTPGGHRRQQHVRGPDAPDSL